MAKDVIIACDFPSMEATLLFLDRFGDTRPYVKIGMELFYAAGPQIVKEIKKRGHKIFLDLKLCDIPNTVKSAMSVLSGLDVDMTNLHAFGGHKMMEAAIEGLTRPDGTRPILIAVTMLTSTSKELMNEDILIPGEVDTVVASYAKTAKASGLDGVVCSPREASIVKEACGTGFITVTPGIRFADSAADDQVRVMTPAKAREIGSDYIVVGRPVTKADDPLAAYERCRREFLAEN
ncbi:MAG: orotidine-5'-phosphate decarboxylase [Muribaculaceae bacterium]|nr:orotidine-5'-phosphate decarboxylase [Muribaculaceae bacterium]